MLRVALALAVAGSLTACSGPLSEAHIPASGITGPNGGATETIYYDAKGGAHFQG